MVLEQHRSSLIPTVSFAAGGRIMVDGDGTFPLAQGKRRDRLPDFETRDANDNPIKFDNSDVESYRSYDPGRKPRFLKRDSSHYESEVTRLNGTVGSGGSQSLQRKLRRFRGRSDTDDIFNDDNTPKFGSLNLTGTMSDRGRSRRTNSYVPEDPYPGSLGRSSGRRKNKQSLSIGTLKRSKGPSEEVYSKSGSQSVYYNGSLPQIPETVLVRNKKLAEDRLPGWVFIVTGGFMALLAIIKLCLSWWHAYYSPIWTSLALISLGINGIYHKGDYLTKWSNALYILFGLLSIISTLACSGLLLDISGPQVVRLGAGFTPAEVAMFSNTTNMGKSLIGNLDVQTIIHLNVGVDFAIIILCMASFYSLTATIVAISNHWDAVYTVTGDCDHRGNPRVFNPMEQAILGLVACFVALFTMGFTGYSGNMYGVPAIAGGLIIAAGLCSFSYGKRPDLLFFGLVAQVMEFLALVGCGGATVFMTLALVQDINHISIQRVPTEFLAVHSPSAVKSSLHTAAILTIVGTGIYYLLIVVNVIFASGILFRVCRKACCSNREEGDVTNETRF